MKVYNLKHQVALQAIPADIRISMPKIRLSHVRPLFINEVTIEKDFYWTEGGMT